MIKRDISLRLISVSKKIPVIYLTGPRQSGKTTLVKDLFKSHRYISLENPDNLEFALNDPKGFLKTYGDKLIIDEAQHAPKLFSYIQSEVDEKKSRCSFILTGSQNFLLHSKISQSLAGRVIIFSLLPFSYKELCNTKFKTKGLSEFIYTGFYPRLYDSKLIPSDWYNSYIQTYLERDVRQILNVGDLNTFRTFLKVCAGRSGQVINLSSIGNDMGVSYQTVKKWLSVLEQSYIIHFLPPFYENFNKRILKSPKLYFYDTGLLCSLLGIDTKKEYNLHYLKGAIFETYVISEMIKQKLNAGENFELYYLRDSNGIEIDCIMEKSSKLKAVEIKAGETLKSDFFKNLYIWNKINNRKNSDLNIVYGGEENQLRKDIKVFGWKSISEIRIK
jgi:predicted AAA+ superfamily ATPase